MNMVSAGKLLRQTLCLCAVSLALAGCSDNVSTLDVTANGSSVLKMTPPAIISNRAINPDNLELVVTINSEPVEMVQSGVEWTGQTTAPEGSDIALEIMWSEQIDSQSLPLAVARETVNSINNNISFEVVDSSYIVDGDGFDADNDSINNITERRQDTDPFDASSPNSSEVVADVIIPGTQQPNVIDGTFNEVFWNNAQFENAADGSTLRIDNQIVDETGTPAADIVKPNYQWAAVHDDEYLTIFVFGKVISSSAGVLASRDSGASYFQDDSLELFFDGDLSQLTNYDSTDDMHIVIPLVNSVELTANNSNQASLEIVKGGNVNPAVVFDIRNVDFAACLCNGERVTWEIRINLAEARLPLDKTFGFDIQINQDDDGGERDTKWAWAAAQRLAGQSKEETDVTWKFPNRMGLMKLIPIN